MKKSQGDFMVVKVELHGLACHGENIREVAIPDSQIERTGQSDLGLLNLAYRFGQNDFQPQQQRSVSVGDIVLLNGERYLVMPFGFKKLTNESYEQLLQMERRDPRDYACGLSFNKVVGVDIP